MTLTDLIPHPRRTEIRTTVTCYTVTAVPCTVDRDAAHHFDITVRLYDHDRRLWLVEHEGDCLTRDGIWEYEPPDQFKTPRWQTEHLFDLEAAQVLAMRAAPDVLWHGVRAGDLR